MHETASLYNWVLGMRIAALEEVMPRCGIGKAAGVMRVTLVGISNRVAVECVVENRTSLCGYKGNSFQQVCIEETDVGIERHFSSSRVSYAPFFTCEGIHDAVCTKIHVQVYALLMIRVLYWRDGKGVNHHLDRSGIGLEISSR